MATATKQDEDLLIISDEDSSSDSSSDIEFSFDFWNDTGWSDSQDDTNKSEVETDAEQVSNEVMDSSVDNTTQEQDLSSQANITETSWSTIDLGIEETVKNQPEVDSALENSQWEDFSFDLTSEEVKPAESVSESVTDINASVASVSGTTESDSSMNDILSGTIAKLTSRQDAIATDKSQKAQKEDELKAQITKLESQVTELEADMAALDSESEKITANISKLESMKLDPVKDHNEKRMKK